MLEDRDYMRQNSRWEPHWSITICLIVINVVVFILQHAIPDGVYRNLILSLDGLKSGYVWQLLTFQFLHQSLGHLLANMIGLFFLGRGLEEALGRGSFTKLYLLSGVVGGLVQMGGGLIWPSHLDVPIIGASAGVSGLLAAYVALFPDRTASLFFIPIEFKIRTLLWITIGMAVLGIIFPSAFGRIAHCAHLGGILAGMLYIRWITQVQKPLVVWQPFRPKPRRRELVKVRSEKPRVWAQPKPVEPEDLPPAEFISKEVDPILDKISAHGIQSLTERERQILEAARARMSKRK